jgi:hypothetical protein
LLLAPESKLALEPDTALVQAFSRLVDPENNVEASAEVLVEPLDFPDEVPLAAYALGRAGDDDAITFALLDEMITLPPTTEPQRPWAEYLRERGKEVHSDLALAFAGLVRLDATNPMVLREPAAENFETLVPGWARQRRQRTTYNFGDTFLIAREIGGVARTTSAAGRTLVVESTLRLVDFSASAVLSLWSDEIESRPPGPHIWRAFAEAARSPSSSSIAAFVENVPSVRFELAHLFRFGAQRHDAPLVELIVGTALARPAWMEKLGMLVAHNSHASVILAEAGK